MNLTMITGSYPPEPCGVGDYTYRLTSELEKRGVHVRVKLLDRCKWETLPGIWKGFWFKAEVYHIQYPTMGYRWSLCSHLLAVFLRSCVVTIHEFSQVHLLRKAAIVAFFLVSKRLIFTTSFELEFAAKYFPFIKGKSVIIPVGSFVEPIREKETGSFENVTYFGLIRPNKGLEQVVELARLLSKSSLPLRVRVIGNVNEANRGYYERIKGLSSGMPIDWVIGLNSAEVSEELSRARVAYIPFPDGVSERRSSAIAMLAHGVVVLTTYGNQTSENLKNTVVNTASPDIAMEYIHLYFNDIGEISRRSRISSDYAKAYSWKEIVERHIKLYSSVSGGSLTGAGETKNGKAK